MDIVLEEPDTEANAIKARPQSRLPRPTAARRLNGSVPAFPAPMPATTASYPTTADCDPSEAPLRRRTADPETMQKVEVIIGQIIHSLQQQNDSISIKLKTRASSETSPSCLPVRSSNSHYKLSFPGNTPQDAWRFSTAELTETVCRRASSMLTCSPAVVLRILELIHEALVESVVISKRNIYYKDPELFKSQKIVDRYVDILAYTFGIQRAALNVSTLIDNVDHIRSIDISNVAWILLVEKEGPFAEAKGYPDISTRAFLRLLSISAYPSPPIYALVDFDPDGIAIMSTYKHGSLTLSHENANLKTPIIRWLGVKSSDLVLDESTSGPNGEERKGPLKLSIRDRKKAARMLGKEICEEDGAEKGWRRELQVMLMLNVKVEMEVLSEREGGVERWVEERLFEGLNSD
ncbi:MAG: hypothetical protein Q9225_006282 [Loekoesia sp. 1 TL-2023]